jgi:hypothetical protein
VTRDELLSVLDVERYAVPPPPPPAGPTPDKARRRRILLGLENPDDAVPEPDGIDADVARMSTDLRWTPKQIAAVLAVDIATVYAVLTRHMNKEHES